MKKLFRFPYVIRGVKIYVKLYHSYVFLIEGSDYQRLLFIAHTRNYQTINLGRNPTPTIAVCLLNLCLLLFFCARGSLTPLCNVILMY